LTVIFWERDRSRFQPRLSPGDTRYIGYCVVFKVRGEASTSVAARKKIQRAADGAPVSQNSTASEPPLGELDAHRSAACLVRSTCLVADHARGGRRNLTPGSRAAVLLVIGAL
jgi:hypothetical protein